MTSTKRLTDKAQLAADWDALDDLIRAHASAVEATYLTVDQLRGRIAERIARVVAAEVREAGR